MIKENNGIEENITTEAFPNTEREGLTARESALSITDQVSGQAETIDDVGQNGKSQNGEELAFQISSTQTSNSFSIPNDLQAVDVTTNIPHNEREIGVVFEGTIYTERVFDKVLNDHVYTPAVNQEPRGELLM